MTQAMAYSASEDRMLDPEQDAEIDGVDPWKAAMQVWFSVVSHMLNHHFLFPNILFLGRQPQPSGGKVRGIVCTESLQQ